MLTVVRRPSGTRRRCVWTEEEEDEAAVTFSFGGTIHAQPKAAESKNASDSLIRSNLAGGEENGLINISGSVPVR